MKRAVFYGRYSSDRQTEQSIEGQRRVCEEFAKAEQIQIVGEYIDRATSGTSTEHREQFQKMLKDSKNGGWDYVLVYKLDRFARSRYDSAISKQQLKKNGVKVLSATERITDSPEGILIEGLLESMDEYFSRELSRKCKRGIRESIIKGHNFGGRVLYGYDRKDKRFVINEEQAVNVRRIFKSYLSGCTIQSIADQLNADGYRTNYGNEFKRYTVSDILHNDKYTGIHYIDGIEEPETCPAIISQTTFDRVKEKLNQSVHRSREHATGHVYALSGLLQCGVCGRYVCGSSVERKYFYYACRSREHAENSVHIHADKLEQVVVDALQTFFTEEQVSTLAERLYQIYTTDMDGKPDRSKRLNEIEKQIQGTVNALIACPSSKALQEKLTQLEEQKAEIEKMPILQPQLKKEHFENYFRWLALRLEHIEDRQTFFHTVIHKVLVYPEKAVIILNMTDEMADPPKREQVEAFMSNVGEVSPCPTLYKLYVTPFAIFIRAALIK